jgi:Holliday junction resolvase RusA-like endonuclease
VNSFYRPAGGGRRVLSAEAARYRGEVEAILRAAGWRPPAGPLELTLELHPPDGRRRDASNFVKQLEDAVFGALGEDDARVVRLVVTKHPPDKTAPRVVARLGGAAHGVAGTQGGKDG